MVPEKTDVTQALYKALHAAGTVTTDIWRGFAQREEEAAHD